MQERRERLAGFADWAARHIKGDEKGEAQIFLDRLFQAFGQPGCLDVGGQPEFRIRKAREDGGGTAFADYVWKPVVLIEMKRRGVDLSRYYRQAFDYWTRLAPGRPRYVILCDFDRFWIYDFEAAQFELPVDQVSLAELPDRYGPLAFLFRTQETPVFDNNHVAVTREAARLLGECFHKLVTRQVPRDIAQRFILQMLVALFAENIELMERYTLAHLLEECKSPGDSHDLLGGLFLQMNNPDPAAGGRFKTVPYFDGGIFAHPARVELYEDELAQLRRVCASDWSKVRPEIFGTLFEQLMEQTDRRASGAHFTSPVDIMKIVEPTIARPWRERIENARSLKDLDELRQRMRTFTVLDPACGSGNFLYMAYREMKRLEADLNERADKLSRRPAGQRPLGFVTARQFYGMDINGFAIELAKVTMMIARKLAIDELHVTEPALPLDNLDANFIAGDALIDAAGRPAAWPKADVIIGNPPFVGSRFLAKSHGYEYVRKLYAAYPDVPKMADYCVYWFRKAHDLLPACTRADRYAGRAGLVGTQNIRNNQSRVGGLDHVVETGTIIEAVDNQPWSGEANVNVAIVNWVKSKDRAVLPDERRIWSKDPDPRFELKELDRSVNPAARRFELLPRVCRSISSALSDRTDTALAKRLPCNTAPKLCYQGQNPCHEGFFLTHEEARRMLRDDPRLSEVLFPYMIGQDLLTQGRPSRWIIDFAQRDMVDASTYAKAFDRVRKLVLPTVMSKAEKERAATGKERSRWTRMAERWWQFRDYQPSMIKAIQAVPRYVVCCRVGKRSIFAFVGNDVHPDTRLMVFPLPDDYSFGLLQSPTHWAWVAAKCSKLKSDFTYTPESVFDTFPWPQAPTAAQVLAVAEAGREIRRLRAEALAGGMKGGLRALYRTLELPGDNPLKDAHAELDKTVMEAYGFPKGGDLLAQLLGLNLAVAARIEQAQTVTAPGIPPGFPAPDELVTDDCIRP